MRRPRDIAFYLAAALSGIAAAYILRRWGQHLCDARNAKRALPDTNDKDPEPSHPPVAEPTDTPPVSQTKSLPPLRTHSLPPPLPNAHSLFSGSFVSIGTPPTTSSGSGDEEQTNTSDSDSFIDLLSPAPTHVVSRRRSMRAAHDLFAESHISFAELGSLVAPQDESK